MSADHNQEFITELLKAVVPQDEMNAMMQVIFEIGNSVYKDLCETESLRDVFRYASAVITKTAPMKSSAAAISQAVICHLLNALGDVDLAGEWADVRGRIAAKYSSNLSERMVKIFGVDWRSRVTQGAL